MKALQLNTRVRPHPYASYSLTVNPNPPRVGEVTTLALALRNSGPDPVTVNRIEFKVAGFGMGLQWEELPPISPVHVPVDPDHDYEVAIQWTPTKGGHRCVRGAIYIEGAPHPIHVGRNLDVIEAMADQDTWHIPFQLGNPETERKPVMLEIGKTGRELHAMLVVRGRLQPAGRPIWLNPGEVIDAQLILKARTLEQINDAQAVEAYIDSKLIDGIQVVVHRPAFVQPSVPRREPVERIARPARVLREAASEPLIHGWKSRV